MSDGSMVCFGYDDTAAFVARHDQAHPPGKPPLALRRHAAGWSAPCRLPYWSLCPAACCTRWASCTVSPHMSRSAAMPLNQNLPPWEAIVPTTYAR